MRSAPSGLKGAAIAEATQFTDESYRRMFIEKARMFAVEQNPDGSVKLGANNLPRYHELTDAEKMNLRPSSDN